MPLDTVLCLDTSGSMQGQGITQLQRAVNAFLDGVQQTAMQTGLRENVAIVEFGHRTRLVQPLGTNYPLLKLHVGLLSAGGTTPMFEGLMLAMREIINRGGVVSLRGTNVQLTPRVILMTDGHPDDKQKVIATAVAFSAKGWSQVGLPHPIPIACVGMGRNVDAGLLVTVAAVTNGMFSIGDASELSTFFRRQVLLIRFLIQFRNDMSSLRNALVLRAFLRQLGEDVDDEETEALLKLLLTMMVVAEGRDSPPQQRRSLPPPSLRGGASRGASGGGQGGSSQSCIIL